MGTKWLILVLMYCLFCKDDFVFRTVCCGFTVNFYFYANSYCKFCFVYNAFNIIPYVFIVIKIKIKLIFCPFRHPYKTVFKTVFRPLYCIVPHNPHLHNLLFLKYRYPGNITFEDNKIIIHYQYYPF